MERFAWLVAVALLACGEGRRPGACSIACDGDGACPAGATCSAGFCAPEGGTCEPAFERVVAGTGFACAADQLQRWWCWGSNEHAQIDASARGFHGRAVLANLRRWDALTLGGGHACGVVDGELWCWGRNDRNQVSGSVSGDVTSPLRIEVPGRTVTWTAAAAGSDYTCAVGDGQLYCWGAGELGKLGGGSVDDATRPQLVASAVVDWVEVAAGGRHTCARSSSLGVQCWGDGSHGELGIGRIDVVDTPQQVALDDAVSLAVGLESTCAVTAAGELWCWGRASAGALGDPAVIDPDGEGSSVPVRASELGGWLEVSAAERYACARRVDGGEPEVWCWGSALAGGIGEGLWQSTRAWTRVLEGATSVDVGWNGTASDPGQDDGDLDLSCATVDGEVRCWGDNRAGQLGQGAATGSELPQVVAGEREWSALAAGDDHVCGTLAPPAGVLCWGSRERGQLDGVEAGRMTRCTASQCDAGAPVPALIEPVRAGLSAGAAHTCAVRGGNDVGVVCWGANDAGQAGAAPAFSVGPTTIAGAAWQAVAAGVRGTCASSPTDPTWCWGTVVGEHGPAPEPSLDFTASIALGDDLGCALLDGDLACFGTAANAYGNGAPGVCGDGTCNAGESVATCVEDCGPPPLTRLGRRYRAIAVGRLPFACGLREDGGVECWGDNRFGQAGETMDLGSGPQVVHPVTQPFGIPELAGCTTVAAGTAHACAICEGGLWCWGDARHGEVGPPTTRAPVTQPRVITPVDTGDPFVEVTLGNGFSCARTQRGTAFCWGRSLHGALGTGVTGANLPVTVQR